MVSLKKIKRIASSVIASVLCISMAVPTASSAFAASTQPATAGGSDGYTVTLAKGEGGQLAFLDGSTGTGYQEGDAVSVAVTPEEGYGVEEINVSTESGLARIKGVIATLFQGKSITSGDVDSTYKDGKLEFSMPASNVTVNAKFTPQGGNEADAAGESATDPAAVPEVQSEDVTKEYAKETRDAGEAQTDPVLESYIKEHADPRYTSVDGISIVNVMIIKQALFDAAKVEEGDTADSIMTDMENGKDEEKFIAQLTNNTAVYNLSDDSDYYVAFVNTMMDDANVKVNGATFAISDTNGNVLDNCIFDAETGLAYIPKSNYLDKETGKDIFLQVQVQLMQLVGADPGTSSVVTSSVEEGTDDVSVYETTARLFDTETTVQAEGGMDEDDVAVSVNGVPLVEDSYSYDPETGEVTVENLSSGSIQSITVSEEKETLTSRVENSIGRAVDAVSSSFITEANAATGASDLNFYEKYGEAVVDFPTWVEIGSLFTGTASYAYGAGENGASKYVYYYSSPSSTLDAVKNGVSNFDYSKVVQSDSGGLFTVVVDFGSGNTIAGGKDPSTGSHMTGSGGAIDLSSIGMVALECSHLDTDLGSVSVGETMGGNFSQQEIKVRVLDLVRDGNTPFAVLGIYTVESHRQTGFGLIKIGVRPNTGTLIMAKKSGNASMTDGNSCYSLENAVYNVYTDAACTKQATDAAGNKAVLTTKADGSSNALEMQAGTYYVKEVTPSKGYKLCTKVHTVTVTSSQKATFTCEEPPGNDPGVIQITKLDSDTGEAVSEGAASLAGAQFTVKYYAGYYDKGNLPAEATREWVIQTKNVSGNYIAMIGDSYKVSGDDFYRTETGTVTLPLGTYAVEETKAPEGYTLKGHMTSATDGTTVSTDGGVYVTQVREDGTGFKLSGGNEYRYFDKVVRGGVKIYKRDKETGDAKPSAGASLEGAEFAIISKNDGKVSVDTNGNGKYEESESYSKGQTVMTIKTNASGLASTSADALPYGDYQIKEVKAPAGYLNSGTITRDFSIREDGVIVDMTAADKSIQNEIIRGGVEIYKRDLEVTDTGKGKKDGNSSPLGGATFAGAQFAIISKNNGVTLVDTNGNGKFEDSEKYAKGDTVLTITTDKKGYAATAEDALPYGDYTIKEVKAPDEGYLASGTLSQDFSIRKDGVVVDMTASGDSISNQVMRGDFKLRKIGSSTQDKVGYVTFRITSDTTGESHEFTTDSMGNYSSAKYKHSKNTNGGGVKDGLWFGQYTAEDGSIQTVDVDDSLGALPYDTYTIQELYIKDEDGNDITGNMNLLTLKLIVSDETMLISEDGTEVEDGMVDMGNVENSKIEISTTAKEEESNTHYAYAGGEVTIIDSVMMTGLTSGTEYTLKGMLYTSKGVPVKDKDGNTITSEIKFTASSSVMEREMEFTFDATGLEGTDVVVFEELYVGSKYVAGHKDPSDEGQTIHFPGIKTEATDSETGDHISKADSEITLVDTVSYTNLRPGKTYKVTGTLMDKETGKAILDAEGKEITAETEFKAEKSDGTVEVTFVFDGSGLAGKTVVVFENLYYKDRLFAVHADINDKEQSVQVPKIGTQAMDEVSLIDVTKADGEITIIDSVAYENLIPGYTYRLVGILMDAATGEALLDDDGKEITAEKEFVANDKSGAATFTETAVSGINTDGEDGLTDPYGEQVFTCDACGHRLSADLQDADAIAAARAEMEGHVKTHEMVAGSGTVEMAFTFKGESLAGTKLVVFEDCYLEDVSVAEHKDITSVSQSVYIPEIGTTALDSETKAHISMADGSVTIVDTVDYRDLAPNHEYTMEGTLMDKGTGEVLMVNGEPVTASTVFTPTEPDGSVDVTFTFDATGMEGKDIVVFEKLLVADYEAAIHEDIGDNGQTIHFPEIGTEAQSMDGGKTVTISSTMTVVDKVYYKNLIPGQVYVTEGTLMDKATGEAIRDAEGNVVTAKAQFVPEEADGEMEVTFTFNGTNLSSMDAVVFEKLFIVNGSVTAEVASHEDIEDEAQTITFRTGVQTGDTMTLGITAAAAAACAGAGVLFLKKRRGKDLQAK